MKKIWFSLLVVVLCVAGLWGCGKSVPPLNLSSYTKIAIAPLATEKKATEFSTALPYDIGTQLNLKFKKDNRIEWIYDSSEENQPVKDKLNELQLSEKQIYVDTALAAKVGSAVGADLIIVGHVSNPRFEEEFDDRNYYDMSHQAGISGTTKFTLLLQSATITVKLKAVDVNTGNVAWSAENLKGYIRYIKHFQSQIPDAAKKAVEEEIVRADLRRHLTKRTLYVIYPDGFEETKVPEILRQPSDYGINLKTSGGKVTF